MLAKGQLLPLKPTNTSPKQMQMKSKSEIVNPYIYVWNVY